jgi:hypothetical protein
VLESHLRILLLVEFFIELRIAEIVLLDFNSDFKVDRVDELFYVLGFEGL